MHQLANRPTGRGSSTLLGWAFRPRNLMKDRMLAVGQAVSPANRPEGRLPSPLPLGFSPLSPPVVPAARDGGKVFPLHERRRQLARRPAVKQYLPYRCLFWRACEYQVTLRAPRSI
jgi:hypothetical protein